MSLALILTGDEYVYNALASHTQIGGANAWTDTARATAFERIAHRER